MTDAISKNPEAGLTPAQLEIMGLFWQEGELNVAQVWKTLNQRRSIARNTVQTTLTRLVDKGWLTSRAEGRAFIFRPTRGQRTTLRHLVNELLDNAFEGSASGLVIALLDARKLSAHEVQRIRAMIDKKEGGTK